MQSKQDSSVHTDTGMKSFTREVKLWNVQVFGHIFATKKRLMARLEGLQKSQLMSHFQELLLLEIIFQKKLKVVLKEEELFWFQKSREK